ncbi:peptidylprolyl isomerase [Aphanothece sacrum]|uniref:peptidylprolyl isomerase n=1 Tax=Aphanothece sacrum FPU1 TaxID=1920663 RepID=A0A401IDX8_APHSA|nr:peptidylprolyl isomerase [Aphanothece sacrum]GBF79451.1 hypothetical protein AsFPU1_0846 [Aphanothece sacrum FPU1]GBF85999.1 hypothetical protein AsFPU3_3069 [Aphanothece sacrum FPU3]
MTIVLQIGDQNISEQELYPILAQYRLLPQLAKEIIVEQAIAEIECSPEEATLAKEQFYQRQQLTNENELQLWLEHHGMTRQQLENLSVRDIKIEKFKQIKWGEQLESYFIKCKGQLDRVVYSLIRTKEAGIAQELYFRLEEGESDFVDLARQYSEGSEAQTGGLIGPVELNVPHPRIGQILSSSKSGQISPPTKVGDWWIIVRLEKYMSAQLDDPTRQRLLNELFQGWLIAQIQQNVSFSPQSELLELKTS